ncbi:MAG: dehydrogenase, partial [Planctomycetes bacterium]|nr:dehydrogenase [Planctomycetota bacterium]
MRNLCARIGWLAAVGLGCLTAGWVPGGVAADRTAIPTAPDFDGYVLTDGLDFPWEMLWGPDDHLWVSERHGRRITRVDPATGEKRTAGIIPEAYPGPQHEGILGMAFGPNFLKDDTDNY